VKKKLSSIIQLIVSLGLATFLIWYFYHSISSSKDFNLATQGIGANGKTAIVNQLCFKDGDYLKKDDSLAILSINGVSTLVKAETEANYHPSVKAGEQLAAAENWKLATYNIDVLRIIKHVFSNAIWLWLVLSLIASLLSHFFRALRWKMMLEALNYRPKLSNTFFAVMIMYLANMAFPRLGEVLRCGVLRRYEKIPIEKSLGTMLTERVIDFLSLILVGIIMFFTQFSRLRDYVQQEMAKNAGTDHSAMYIKYGLILGVAGLLFVVVMIFIRKSNSGIAQKVRNIMIGLWDGIKSIRYVKNPLLLIIYSASIWTCYVLTIYFCLKAVPETSMLGMDAAITCLFFGSFAIVAVQGGLGVYPAVVSKVLVLYGVGESIGYAYGWLSWVAQTSLVLLLGFVSLLLLSALNEKPGQDNQ
jgi:glycosyltransferase 2 family protein